MFVFHSLLDRGGEGGVEGVLVGPGCGEEGGGVVGSWSVVALSSGACRLVAFVIP